MKFFTGKTRKGVNIYIAAVMLFALTVSIAAMLPSFFLPNLNMLQSDTENKSKKLVESTDYRLEIAGAEYSDLDDRVDVTLQNKGKSINGNISVTLMCDSASPLQKVLPGIGKGKTVSTSFDTPDCQPDELIASLKRYPVETKTDSFKRLKSALWSQSSASEFESVALSSSNIVFASIELEPNQNSQNESSSFSGNKINLTESGGKLKLSTS